MRRKRHFHDDACADPFDDRHLDNGASCPIIVRKGPPCPFEDPEPPIAHGAGPSAPRRRRR